MDNFEDLDFQDTSNLKVIYVHYVGKNSDNLNVYHFLISENIEDTWQEGWEEKPACNMTGLLPDEDKYEYVKELITDINFDLVQDNCCFSLSDCRDHCIALALENIDDYEEYPEPLRLVFQFGETLSDVEFKLAKRDLKMRYI